MGGFCAKTDRSSEEKDYGDFEKDASDARNGDLRKERRSGT